MSSRDFARAKKSGAYQWRTNPARGESFILYRWQASYLTLSTGAKYGVQNGWVAAARIYKASKGDRWVYRSIASGQSAAFTTVREAMRMAVLLIKLENQE